MEIQVLSTAGLQLSVSVSGKIDTTTISALEDKIFSEKDYSSANTIIFDFDNVSYISSIGLRLLLKLQKDGKEVSVINVHPSVYEIFDVTGFVNVLNIKKAFREVDVSDCEIIGEGQNGIVYRLDNETILKLYKKEDVLDSIVSERAHAQYAFFLGIPTAISFDVVKVGNKYGSVFELVDAKSVAVTIIEHPEMIDFCVESYVELLRTIHSTVYIKKEVVLDSAIEKFKLHIEQIKESISEKMYAQLCDFSAWIPDDNTIIHGDPQPNNVMITKDGLLFIDMDTLAVGHPVFDFGYLYSTLIGFIQHKGSYNIPSHLAELFWDRVFNLYFKDLSAEDRAEYYIACKIISYTQILRYSIRHEDTVYFAEKQQITEQLEISLDDFSKVKQRC